LIRLDASDDIVDLADVIELDAAVVVDQAGLSPAQSIPATAGADAATPATITALGTRCSATQDAVVSSDIEITISGDYEGAAGNAFTMTVTNQRGLLIPTVTVDTTAKTIAIVADTSYHDASDVATVMQNNLLANAVLGNFSVTGGTGLTATVVPARAIGGISSCEILISANEPVAIGSLSGASASVNNVPVLSISDAAAGAAPFTDGAILQTVNRTTSVVTVSTSQLGTGAILFGAGSQGISDIRGSNTVTAVAFTAG
jgi:hypothetical protein